MSVYTVARNATTGDPKAAPGVVSPHTTVLRTWGTTYDTIGSLALTHHTDTIGTAAVDSKTLTAFALHTGASITSAVDTYARQSVTIKSGADTLEAIASTSTGD